MYRDDLAATYARAEQLQRELAEASSQAVQDRQRIAMLNQQLIALQQQLARGGGQMQYQQYGNAYMLPSRGSTILVFGILSLVVCSVLGPIAWSMGNDELRRIDAGQASPLGRGNATAGRICGMISTILLIVGGVIALIVVAAAGMASGSHY